VTSVRLKKLASWALPISVSLAILILLYRGIPARSLLEGLARIDLRWAAAYVILSALEPLLRGPDGMTSSMRGTGPAPFVPYT